MAVYIHQLKDWPLFTWEAERLASLQAEARFEQGKILGQMQKLGFDLQAAASLDNLSLDLLKSGEIEGEIFDPAEVRSSLARRLGLDYDPEIIPGRRVDAIAELMLDATRSFDQPLTAERLFRWQAALFPTGQSGLLKIKTGAWRDNLPQDPMQVVSGPMGRETVHFKAPDAELVPDEMNRFLDWFNSDFATDPFLKAALAHLWFITIHPFDDGNGRIARAITDLQLCRADQSSFRFYSMSAQIRKERNAYYKILEQTQKDSLDLSDWMEWFLKCLLNSFTASASILEAVMQKARFWSRYQLQSFNPRQLLMLNKLMDGFTGKLTTSKWAALCNCSHDTALRDIQDLLRRNILKKEEAGGRSTGYVMGPSIRPA